MPKMLVVGDWGHVLWLNTGLHLAGSAVWSLEYVNVKRGYHHRYAPI